MNLTAEEFAFRYLFDEASRLTFRPLDEVERVMHRGRARVNSLGGESIEPEVRRSVIGLAPHGDAAQRFLGALLSVYLPARLQPRDPYSLHTCYPSPRSYYPLQITIVRQGKAAVLDTNDAKLTPVEDAFPLDLDDDDFRLAAWVRVDFTCYDVLYNQFRKALFALECGHFLAELLAMATAAGLRLRPRWSHAGLWVNVVEGASRGIHAEAFRKQLGFARERNSGNFVYGLFPRYCRLTANCVAAMVISFTQAESVARQQFPHLRKHGLDIAFCLREGEGFTAGIYRRQGSELTLSKEGDVLQQCEKLYNYANFSFATMAGMLFISVPSVALSDDAVDVLELNCAIGFVMQHIIRALYEHGLFGRPCRSFDQHGVDRLLDHGLERKAYYGLLVGKNRQMPSMGVLR